MCLLLCCNVAYAGSCSYVDTVTWDFKDEFIGFMKSTFLICGNKNSTDCDNEEIIFLPKHRAGGDYNTYVIGDASSHAVRKNRQNDFYKCNVGDDSKWTPITVDDLPPCKSIAGLEKITTMQIEGGDLYGVFKQYPKTPTSHDSRYYTNVCVDKGEVAFECEPGKYYVDTSVEDPVKLYKCGEDKKLADSDRYMDRCFDINDINPSIMAPEGFSAYGNKTNYRAYLNKDKVSPVTGYENIYQWSSDITSMCWWCNSGEGWFATVIKNGEENIVDCTKNEEEAWCLYAKNQEGKNTVWDGQEGLCICNNIDEEWNKNSHTCEKKPERPDNFAAEIDGFECTQEIAQEGKKYAFMNDDYRYGFAQQCVYRSTFYGWDTAGKIDDCYTFDEWTSVEMPMSSNFKHGKQSDYNLYVKDDVVSIRNGKDIYEYNPDKSKMCVWCASSKYIFFESSNPGKDPAEGPNFFCTDNKQQAECFYAKLKEGKKVDWDYENEKCIGEGMKKAPDTPVISDEPRVPVVSKEDFEAAKSAVDDFFEKANEKASGWKDATGKVNAKRIASDVTAGVVLGTVGGVVSGVVIKKKQIEKGFEVLHCAIGGQTVANWGDTFTVGLRR